MRRDEILTKSIGKNLEFEMSREILNSDHKFHSLGVFPHYPIEFTTLPESFEKLQGTTRFDGIMSIQFYYSLDFVEHKRQIYSPLDFLGDVGGLTDALFPIGALVVSLLQLIFGNPLSKYMIQAIF